MPQAAITDQSPHCPTYKRHQPEQTLLYHIIERHNSAAMTSPDGIVWNRLSSGVSNGQYGSAWSGSQWVTVGNSAILISP